MDPPAPGFVRVLLACVACGHEVVLDVQRRAIDPPVAARHWQCEACRSRNNIAVEERTRRLTSP